MTPVQTALASGYVALKAASGRSCLFRGATVVAIIDDTGGAYEPRGSGGPDFETITQTVIEIEMSDVPVEPRSGEVIIDDTNRRHNIRSTQRRGDHWRMVCKPYVPTL